MQDIFFAGDFNSGDFNVGDFNATQPMLQMQRDSNALIINYLITIF